MAWAVTESVQTQLWIDRTCRVNLNYSGWSSFQKLIFVVFVEQNPAETHFSKKTFLSLNPAEEQK